MSKIDHHLSIWQQGRKQCSGKELHLALYSGRVDGSLPSLKHQNVFAFVIDGICEMNDRLLETRDGLALYGSPEVTFESLSPQSVLLFLSGV